MIIVDIGRLQLAIAFTHPKRKDTHPHGPTRHTVCEIFELLSGGQAKAVAEGRVACSCQDQFRKETGRKLALERAICNHVYNVKTQRCKKCTQRFISTYSAMRLTKDERQRVWEAYRSRGSHILIAAAVGSIAPTSV